MMLFQEDVQSLKTKEKHHVCMHTEGREPGTPKINIDQMVPIILFTRFLSMVYFVDASSLALMSLSSFPGLGLVA